MGADMSFTDCEEDGEKRKGAGATEANSTHSKSSVVTPFDPRLHRPMDVKVVVELHSIQAHLVKVFITKGCLEFITIIIIITTHSCHSLKIVAVFYVAPNSQNKCC